MGTKTGRVRIGTSGWNYPHWKDGVFYPKGLAQSRWLEFYADRFDTVELNSSFYRLPAPETFADWRGQVRGDRRWARQGLDVYCYYNNDMEGHAVRNALYLRDQLADLLH